MSGVPKITIAESDELKTKVANILNSLSQEIIRSLAGWEYILEALSI